MLDVSKFRSDGYIRSGSEVYLRGMEWQKSNSGSIHTLCYEEGI